MTPLEPLPTGLSSEGALRHPVRAVLFDVYGTLFICASGDAAGIPENSGRIPKTLSAFAKELDIRIPADELVFEYRKTVEEVYNGLKTRGVDFPEVQIDEIWREILGANDTRKARKFALGFELIVNPVYPMPHLYETISHFSKEPYKTGIISNAQFYTPLTFEYFCGKPPENMGFEPSLVFYSFRWGRAKPSPQLFENAAGGLSDYKIQPQNVLFVGNDMLTDIVPARAQGFQTALFAGDYRSLRLREDDPRCRNVVPDIRITDLLELTRMEAFGQSS